MDVRALILTVIMVFALGCGGGGGQDGPSTSTAAFAGGQTGLQPGFMGDAPPDQVYDTSDSTFDISLRLENQGETNIPPGNAKITITGIDPTDFGNPQLEKALDFDLLGVRLEAQGTRIPGTIANTDFSNLVFSADISGKVNFNLKASACIC